eukprot:m.32607 g.32607  ORF g.32607 m.32607 type:complete len:412 (-) comp9533_c0_seq1:691-1926(-)
MKHIFQEQEQEPATTLSKTTRTTRELRRAPTAEGASVVIDKDQAKSPTQFNFLPKSSTMDWSMQSILDAGPLEDIVQHAHHGYHPQPPPQAPPEAPPEVQAALAVPFPPPCRDPLLYEMRHAMSVEQFQACYRVDEQMFARDPNADEFLLQKQVYHGHHFSSEDARVVIKVAPAHECCYHLVCQAKLCVAADGETVTVDYHPNVIHLYEIVVVPPGQRVVLMPGHVLEPSHECRFIMVLQCAARGDLWNSMAALQGVQPTLKQGWCRGMLECLQTVHDVQQFDVPPGTFLSHFFEAGTTFPRLVFTDTKPDNLFVHGDGTLVLGDFGGVSEVGTQPRRNAASPEFWGGEQECHTTSDVHCAMRTVGALMFGKHGIPAAEIARLFPLNEHQLVFTSMHWNPRVRPRLRTLLM